MKNPFSLTFGKEPLSLISRNLQNEEIIESFKADNPDFQVCMITGVRGSGKTVAMTTIANDLRKDDPWLVVDLNPERDLLNALASELSSNKDIIDYLKNAQINFSAFGFGVGFTSGSDVKDITVLLNAILEKITKENKDKVISMLNTYGLKDFIYKYPSNLSGGMKQRAALIRTLAINPDILLLDEPFSALDYQTRLAVSDDV